jgi:superfamily II DNA/RNA helicase
MQQERPFSEFQLSEKLLGNLESAGFKFASPIQDLTIGPILEGQDIFALAETGSGKTGSFVIPIIELITRSEEATDTGSYVILSPTRELAQQTRTVVEELGKGLDITSASIIGGEDIQKQIDKIKQGAKILVCTPGRLVDLKKQKIIDLNKVKGIVFDEADRLFDMGFAGEIESILQACPKSRQIIMVSATGHMEVLKTAYKYHSQPLEIKLNQDELVVDSIDHHLAMLSADEKMPLLVKTLREHEDAYALVFCNTQYQTHLVAEWLKSMEFKAKPISGRLAQNKRTKLMEEFRDKTVTILVCTDVAARGLDIKDINLVINYDMPSEAANYVHRVGRTGRAGASGKAISFCAHEDCENLEAIYKLLDQKIPKMELSDEDFAAKVTRKPRIDGKTLRLRSEGDDSRRSGRDRKRNRDDRPDSRNREDGRRRDKSQPEREQKALEPLEVEKVNLPSFISYPDSEQTPVDTRVYQITSDNLKQAKEFAASYFRVRDIGLIEEQVLVKGRKKFFLFGPRTNTYKLTLKPIFKRILTPVLEDILALSYLDIKPEVSYKNGSVRVYLQGKDLTQTLDNKFEFCNGLESYCKAYLTKKVFLPKNFRLSVLISKFDENNPKPARDSRKGGDHKRNDRGRRPRSDKRGSRGRRDDRGQRSYVDEKQILKIAEETKDEVMQSKSKVIMKPLNPAERRLVHQFISDFPELSTSSIGDGRLKKIEVEYKA